MYDLTVIGAGWAGFNAAIRAKELGLKVCLIESASIGGTCLNHGCIPTKTLIQSAKVFSLTKKSADFGIKTNKPAVNFKKIQERKNKIIREFALGMQSRLGGVGTSTSLSVNPEQSRGIDFIKSTAQIISANKIKTGSKIIETKFILIATGSSAIELPSLKFDAKKIISSSHALSLSRIPKSLLIIGGGIIGCEFASLFSTLGSKVTIVEKMPLLLPGEDKDIARKIEVIFKKKGIKISTNTEISAFDLKKYSQVLVCVGRTSESLSLGLEGLGIKLKDRKIVVDDYLKTSIDNIYAAGDCVSDLKLAHFAAYQGRLAVENMFTDNKKKIDNKAVPACIFTDPQIASVGLNEEDAAKAGFLIKVNKFDFRACAMARIIGEFDGFIKVISDQNSKKLIGASIIGPLASELIAIFCLAISASLTVEQVRAIIFAHPTLSESIHETL